MFFKTSHFNTVNSWRFPSKIKRREEIQIFAFLELSFAFSIKKDIGNIYYISKKRLV